MILWLGVGLAVVSASVAVVAAWVARRGERPMNGGSSRFTAAGTNDLMIFGVITMLTFGFTFGFVWQFVFNTAVSIDPQMFKEVLIFALGAVIGAKATEKGIEKGTSATTAATAALATPPNGLTTPKEERQ